MPISVIYNHISHNRTRSGFFGNSPFNVGPWGTTNLLEYAKRFKPERKITSAFSAPCERRTQNLESSIKHNRMEHILFLSRIEFPGQRNQPDTLWSQNPQLSNRAESGAKLQAS